MKGKYLFREPLMLDGEGLYITAAQMQFYLNRPNGEKKFKRGDVDFLNYYGNCRIYNFVYDMMEENEDCASMYWDDKSETIALSFPTTGKVATAIAIISNSLGEDFEEDDPFDLFK